jgi:hypothetical protein
MFLKKLFAASTPAAVEAPKNIYGFSARDIDGNDVNLSKYK